jgi:multisubunit Na+/H+ antiporter MnhB subunit
LNQKKNFFIFRQMEQALNSNRRLDLIGRAAAAAAAAAALAAIFIVWKYDPNLSTFYPTCPLYRLTGYACPGCGMTRGLHALLHGDLLASLDYNAMLLPVLILLAYIWWSSVLYAAKGHVVKPTKFMVWFLWSLLVALLAFGVLRNLPFAPFNWLFP